MLNFNGTPPGLLFHFAERRCSRMLPTLNDAPGEFPPSFIGDESMPPHQENPVLAVDNDGDSDPLKPDSTMLEPLTSRWQHVNTNKTNPRIVVDQPLAERFPAK